jgi:hypothetical protein
MCQNNMEALVVGFGTKVCEDLRKGKTSYRSTKTLSMSLYYVCNVMSISVMSITCINGFCYHSIFIL